MKAKIAIIVVLISIAAFFGFVFRGGELNPLEKEKSISFPREVDLAVPFTSQAPFGDWSYPFSHSCEEASVLMVHYYLEGKTVIDPAAAKKELLDLVEYQKKTYGFHEDTTAEQTAQLIRDYYGYRVAVSYNVSAEDIKRELAKGNPVIVPAAGRMLANPYFTGLGPVYHMLVVKGYNANGFITNDPGTKRGADYAYSYEIFMGAIHDWNNGDAENGTPAILSISRY